MAEEKLLIGIDGVNKDSEIGSLILAMVVTKSDFFRKFSWLDVKDSRLLNKKQITKIIEHSQKYIISQDIEYIKPKDILLNKQIKSIIGLLNRQQRFWNHKIFIEDDNSKEEFINKANQFLPENLKTYQRLRSKKFDMEKWTIMQGCNTKHKICSLASCYAKYYSNIETDDIKSVWGDFGSGRPSDPKTIEFLKKQPECPHIRNQNV